MELQTVKKQKIGLGNSRELLKEGMIRETLAGDVSQDMACVSMAAVFAKAVAKKVKKQKLKTVKTCKMDWSSFQVHNQNFMTYHTRFFNNI